MSNRQTSDELTPRNGHTLVVSPVARISGCQNQKEESLEDQVDHAKEEVAWLYTGPVEYRIISTRGKGEALDRPELAEIEAMIRTREVDLLVMEDVGRLVRGTEAVRLWGIAVDHGTRCIAPNDCLDTADETWEEELIAACRDHVGHNSHTSKRIKKKLMNRFRRHGGATAREIAGYEKPEGAKSYDDWIRVDELTPLIRKGAQILRESECYEAVAEWFNDNGMPVGKYCRNAIWDGKMVRRFYWNPLLKGVACRGTRMTVKHHESGRRKPVKNPDGPVYYECPALAHLAPVEFDELQLLLTRKNQIYRRKGKSGEDPLKHVPRKRTRFPGQHAVCWYCGRQLVWGANGTTDALMCNGSREYACWNSIGVPGTLTAGRIVDAVTAALARLEDFDDQFRQLVQDSVDEESPSLDELRRQLERDERSHERAREKVKAALLQWGPTSVVTDMNADLEREEVELSVRRAKLTATTGSRRELPGSVAELRQLFDEKFRELAVDSWEFGQLLRKIVPSIHTYNVRLCDGGHPLPRALVQLDLSGIAPDARRISGLGELLTMTLTLDLFEPPQRERIRPRAARLADEGLALKRIARVICEDDSTRESPTSTAVHNALKLNQRMRELGLETPCVPLLEPPDDYRKLRRHRSPKYQFRPVPDYERPALS